MASFLVHIRGVYWGCVALFNRDENIVDQKKGGM